MTLIEGLLLITTVHLLAAASPGPDFVLVSQQTLSSGKKAGILTSIGIALGLSVHIFYSSLGLAAVIASSEVLLLIIKFLGGAYLIYLGYQSVKSSSVQTNSLVTSSVKSKQMSVVALITKGFLCNALNPKAPIYFVALFTMILSPTMPLWELVIYGVWMMILQFAWFAIVVLLLSRPIINSGYQRAGHLINKLLGAVFIVVGINVLTSNIH
ncbi:LysE family transporter [Colwellia sp. MEBiC06753]